MDNQRLFTLLAGTAQRDASAFSQLYQEFSPTVYGIALSVVKEPHTAADATQEVFLRLWTLPPARFPRENPGAWLYTVTRRQALEHLQRQRPLSLEEAPPLPELSSPLENALDWQSFQELLAHLETGGGLHPPGDCRPAPPEPRHRPLEVRQGHPRTAAVLGGLAGGFAAGLFGTAGAAAPSPHCGGPQRGRPLPWRPRPGAWPLPGLAARPAALPAGGAASGGGGRPFGPLPVETPKKIKTRQQKGLLLPSPW